MILLHFAKTPLGVFALGANLKRGQEFSWGLFQLTGFEMFYLVKTALRRALEKKAQGKSI